MDLAKIYSDLKEEVASGRFTIRLIQYDVNNNKYKVHLAIDQNENKQKLVLIQAPSGGKVIDDLIANINSVNSFNIVTFPSNDNNLDVFYAIKLINNAEDEIFFKFIEDLLKRLTDSKDDAPFLTVLKRVKSWMNFFKAKRIGILSEESQIGFFAELCVLRELLIKNAYEPLQIIKGWEGPFNQNHDFVFENHRGIEVKCTRKNNPYNVSISNEFQLDNSNFEKLFLVVFQIKRHKNNDFEKLPDVIDAVFEILSEDQDCVIAFQDALFELGYVREAGIEYNEYCFQILQDNLIYSITDTFPKIVPPMLGNSISDVNYIVNVSEQEILTGTISDLITL
jgi:hypothetical protein